MVSQADRDLIRNFVSELRPYLDMVESGIQEFAGPASDGIVVGQAVQALGMIKGAGSVLMIDGLVAIADWMIEAFDVIQQNPEITPHEAMQRLSGIASALLDLLEALDNNQATDGIVLRAQTIFESILIYSGPRVGTVSLGKRNSLDDLFDDGLAQAQRHSADSVEERAHQAATTPLNRSPENDLFEDVDRQEDQVLEPAQSEANEVPGQLDASRDDSVTMLPAGSMLTDEKRVRFIPKQPDPIESAPEIDPELREIFVEEATDLILSFGENARAIARRPDDFEAIEQLRRDAHTIKGAANMTGFMIIGRIGAAVENLLDEHVDSVVPANRETLELLLVCWKMLRAMMPRLDDLSIFTSPSNSIVQHAETLRLQVASQATASVPQSDVLREETIVRPIRQSEVDEVVAHAPAALEREHAEMDAQHAEDDAVADASELEESSGSDHGLEAVSLEETSQLPQPVVIVNDIPAGGDLADEDPGFWAPVTEAENEVVQPFWTPGTAELMAAAAIDPDLLDGVVPATITEPFWTVEDELAPVLIAETDLVEVPNDDPFWTEITGEADEVEHREVDVLETDAIWLYDDPGDDTSVSSMSEDVQVEAASFWSNQLSEQPENLEPVAEIDELEHADPFWTPVQDDLDSVASMANPVASVKPDELLQNIAEQASRADVDNDRIAITAEADEQHLDKLEELDAASTEITAEAFDLSDVNLDDSVAPEWFNEPADFADPIPHDLPTEDAGNVAAAATDRGDLSEALLDMAFAVEAEQPEMNAADVSVFDESRESELAAEMFETFALECVDHIEALNRAAMTLDRNPNSVESIREIKRALHTLKGASAAADFDAISERCHQLEDTLAALERVGGRADSAFVSKLFATIEDIESIVAVRRTELFGSTDTGLDILKPDATTLRVDLNRVDSLLNTVGELVVNRAGLEQRLERLSATLDELTLSAARLQRSNYMLEREAFTEDTVGRLIRGEFAGPGLPITIGNDRVAEWDMLEMDRYTEFDRLIRQLTEVGADVGTAVGEIAQIRGDLDTISNRQRRLTTNLQDELMSVRMIPISSAAPRLYRVVRRVANSRGKQANLVLEGGDTPFDKILLEALSEPLLHLLRNAVDHGIEAPEERRRLGKPEAGTIKIRARRDGSEVTIDIVDDGAGIDHEKVLERARASGHEVPQDVTRQQALRYIFLPGFSTRDVADEVSGRGVGLEIVEQTMTRFKGRLAVDSIQGSGTMFSLRLPVQLSVTQAFLVSAGGGNYAIPISNIEYVVDRQDQPLTRFGESVVVETNDATIPVIDLSERFGRPEMPIMERETGWIMVADVGSQRRAIVVDQLESQQEIVVKPLGRYLRNQATLMGATILGNGDVALIVDIPRLLGMSAPSASIASELAPELASAARPDQPGQDTTAHEPERPRANVALIVDDSLSVRRVVGRTLERHGWVTVLARDGVEALDLLEDDQIDIAITDIEMPRMDGFELLTSIRNRPALSDLPVIVLTSRSGEKHRGRSFELGADAYLVKPFQEQELLETVEKAVRATSSIVRI